MIKGLKFGDKFCALIRDGRGKIYDLNYFMFISKSDEYIICSNYISGITTMEEFFEYYIKSDCDDKSMYIIHISDCYGIIEEANKAFEREAYQENEFWR